MFGPAGGNAGAAGGTWRESDLLSLVPTGPASSATPTSSLDTPPCMTTPTAPTFELNVGNAGSTLVTTTYFSAEEGKSEATPLITASATPTQMPPPPRNLSHASSSGQMLKRRLLPKMEYADSVSQPSAAGSCSPLQTPQELKPLAGNCFPHSSHHVTGVGGGGRGNKTGSSSSSATSPGSPTSTTSTAEGQARLLTKDSLKEKEEDCPKRMCLVCGDVASGFHYGVSSCEACKAFFKRTIQGNIDYTCPANSECEINKRRRKACQACRFHKCLRMGMLKEGVRLDRVRGGRQKYRRMIDNPYGSTAQASKRLSLEENKVLVSLTRCEPELLLALPDPSIPDNGFKTISTLSDFYDRELVGTIGWAKQIPGFAELSLNDQMRLLQGSWSEILTLTLIFRSLPRSSGRLNFAADFALTEAMAVECGMAEFYDHCSRAAERLERVGIRREEFLILKAIVLSNCDVQVEEHSALWRLRDSLLSALYDCVAVIRSGNPTVHVQNLLLLLPSIRQSDPLLRKFWSNVRAEGKVPLNKLLGEMLEAQSK